MEYEEAKQTILKELKGISPDCKIRFHVNEKVYGPQEFALELENETELGKWYIDARIRTEESIQKILDNPPKKRWWKICEKLKSKKRKL